MAVGVSAFANLLISTPLLLVWISGVVLAGLLWSRQRTVALLMMCGFLLTLFTEIIGGLLTASIPFPSSARTRGVTSLGLIFGVIGLIRGMLMTLAWGLLLAAVWRGAASSANDRHREPVTR
ncbi:MAG TPA: hypothetical protein VIL85_25000 [Thermomicrobiales bacterium]|jgi:hypothetical protein